MVDPGMPSHDRLPNRPLAFFVISGITASWPAGGRVLLFLRLALPNIAEPPSSPTLETVQPSPAQPSTVASFPHGRSHSPVNPGYWLLACTEPLSIAARDARLGASPVDIARRRQYSSLHVAVQYFSSSRLYRG